MPKSNPFEERLARKGIGAGGRAAEKKAAQRIGGRLKPGSGSKDGHKGDFTVADFLVENKSTVHESLSIKLEWLRKVTKEAMPHGRTPALALQFTDPQGRPQLHGAWVAIPEHVFKELMGDA